MVLRKKGAPAPVGHDRSKIKRAISPSRRAIAPFAVALGFAGAALVGTACGSRPHLAGAVMPVSLEPRPEADAGSPSADAGEVAPITLPHK